MFHFFPDRNQALSVIQAQTVKARQVPGQRTNLLCPIIHGNPVNQIQRIVEKMGIDLCLQGPHFRHFDFFTELVMFLHQTLHFLHHAIEVMVNFFDFIPFCFERQIRI